jgi:hypothetical protein
MRISKAAAAIAALALASGITATALTATHPASHQASTHQASTRQASTGRASTGRASAQLVSDTKPAPADPSLAWLASAGGQAQVTFNTDVDTLAAALEVEDHSPTVANHLAFEAGARTVRAEARTILGTPALLPATNRGGYERMLKDFIVVANLLQPGPDYGTTAQDDTAWYTALSASNITVA